MKRLILNIYDYFLTHRRFRLLSFIVLTVAMLGSLLKLDFKEDISAFLPLNGHQQEVLSIYQDISGAGKVLAIFQSKDTTTANPDEMVEAVNGFESILSAIDTLRIVHNLVTEFNLEKLTETSDFVYHNIPYFLTEEDYPRMDSLLSIRGFIAGQLETDKQLLMFPTSGMLSANLQKDPLNLFSPVVSKLSRTQDAHVEIYDGRIFTPDMKRAIAILESPFGNSETRNNAILMEMLQQAADSIEHSYNNVSVHYIGGPAIAVENAAQIKRDSVLSISIAVLLITILLVIAFRKFRNILLIVISVGWGWLFALAVLSTIHNSVSLIVIGISSIILGIAVNYPLHLIAHTDHTQSMRQVLREIITPLIIGNITTVGAFMALVPLQATALQDLGIFSAFILIGTILFVIVFLPHSVKVNAKNPDGKPLKALEWISNLTLENHRWVSLTVLALTCLFAYYSPDTKFDTNMGHINYMTQEQQADMKYFNTFTSGTSDSTQCIYVVSPGSSIDEALASSLSIYGPLTQLAANHNNALLTTCHRFLPSQTEQKKRLRLWSSFIEKHREDFNNKLPDAAALSGFQKDAFTPFLEIVNSEYEPKDFSFFSPLHPLYAQCLSLDSLNDNYRIISNLRVSSDLVEEVKKEIDAISGNHFSFDVQSMNSAMADGLSENFNYIGWACGLIVFFFLWFSFGSIELALLSFLPMAMSWIWILGIMGMSGMQFNIVNIILATFIFGQGDDYTIFMTEGCCYEYAFRKKMLASYKRSIILSALIMFIGIGTLIFAKHPALHSLAEVTIVGMFSVVLMAYLLPPLVFRWMTRLHGEYRKRPLSLGPLMRTWYCGVVWLSQLLCGYLLGGVLFSLFKRNATTESLFHRFVSWCHRIDTHIMPGVKVNMHNPYDEQLEKPCIIACNHQSLLDPMFFMAWSPKILIVANEKSSLNPVVRIMFRWLGFYTVKSTHFTAWKDSTLDRDLEKFRTYVKQGYSIAFFPEGMRNPHSSVLRYHKGAFYLAQQLGVEVLPVLLHGVNNLMPSGSFACHKGTVHMHIEKRIGKGSDLWSDDCSQMTRSVHLQMNGRYHELCAQYEQSGYFVPLVTDRYRYKGNEVMKEIRRNLKRSGNYSTYVDKHQAPTVHILHCGYGEMALLMALVHPTSQIIAYEGDKEKLELARYAAEGIVENLEYQELSRYHENITNNTNVYDVSVL